MEKLKKSHLAPIACQACFIRWRVTTLTVITADSFVIFYPFHKSRNRTDRVDIELSLHVEIIIILNIM